MAMLSMDEAAKFLDLDRFNLDYVLVAGGHEDAETWSEISEELFQEVKASMDEYTGKSGPIPIAAQVPEVPLEESRSSSLTAPTAHEMAQQTQQSAQLRAGVVEVLRIMGVQEGYLRGANKAAQELATESAEDAGYTDVMEQAIATKQEALEHLAQGIDPNYFLQQAGIALPNGSVVRVNASQALASIKEKISNLTSKPSN